MVGCRTFANIVMGNLLFLSIGLAQGSFPDLPAALDAISGAEIRRYIEYLGSDELAGRATGSPGERAAAEYIASHLQHLGLAFPEKLESYFQRVPMHGSIPLAESRLRLFLADKVRDFELGEDYLLFKSGAQTYVPQPVPLVFAGYGIVAPEFDYNDYQNLAVEGKIVVYFSGEPRSNDPQYFAGGAETIYASPEAKARLAISRGSLGSILIPLPEAAEAGFWQSRRREFAFEEITLAYAASSHLNVMLNPAAAPALFQGAPFSFPAVLEMAADQKLISFPLAASLSFKGEFIQRDFTASNVIGVLPGSDPKLSDSYLIMSAHYDHLGVGEKVKGDSIYNGVFDNAAGTAALLEIARAFSELPTAPPRTIIFLFLTGEEKGLLGSRYYLDNPVQPLYKTIANVNIDGLAMFDTFNDIVGIGAELSTLGDDLREAASINGLAVSPLPAEFTWQASFARSDQIAFAQAGIPSLLTLEGLDYRHSDRDSALARVLHWNRTIYHTPFDDLQQPIDEEAMAQHARLIFTLCRLLADRGKSPEWHPGAPYLYERLQSIAEKK